MAKPFKVTGPTKANTGIGRMPDGKFTRLEAPSPPKIREEAMREGETVSEVLREKRVPHHLVGSAKPKDANENPPRRGPNEDTPGHAQAPVYEDAIPWPAAGPINDADKVPMKLDRQE